MLPTQSSRSHVDKTYFLTGSNRPEADVRESQNSGKKKPAEAGS
jgi:hypothetical protein